MERLKPGDVAGQPGAFYTGVALNWREGDGMEREALKPGDVAGLMARYDKVVEGWGPYRIDDVGRYTFNNGIKVWTSWLPVSRFYETLVSPAPADLIVWLGGDTWEDGTSRADAEARFASTVARIHQYLADRQVA
jgi:hypothetical protein